MPKCNRSASICDSLRETCSVHLGRGVLPLLAVMLLAAPQPAFAQETVAVTLSKTSLTVDEDGSGTYDVKLNAEPSKVVVLTIIENSDAITIDDTDSDTDGDQTTLTFNPGTTGDDLWNVNQTVTVRAADDDNAVDEKVTITHTATVDGKPATVNRQAVTVSVTVNDPDSRGVTVGSLTPSTVPEAGSASYTVKLTSEPTDTVTIDVEGASGEVTVSPTRLFFTPGVTSGAGHWDTEQTVTVYAGEDFDNDNDSATLTHKVRGGDYTGESAASVTVNVDDNDDTRSVTVSTATMRIFTGQSASYTVVLDSQPNGTVKINVTESPESDDLSVSPASLTFSRSNWNRPRTVRVSTKAGLTSGAEVTLIQAIDTTLNGRDENWTSDLNVSNVAVSIITESTSVALSTSSVTVNEGATATYRVRLRSEPTGTTTVGITVPSEADVSANPTSLEFTTENWNTWQDVTLTGLADDDAVRETFALTHRVSSEADATLRVTVGEKDTRRVTLSETSLEVQEGDSAQYSVVLDSKPTGNVTVTVGGASGDVTVSPAQMTFSTTTWSTAQTVTVNAGADDDGQTDPAVTLTHRVRGADYDGLGVGTVRVTVTETEKPGITASVPSLTLAEGATDEYTVKLDSQPTATVTVTVQGLSGDVTVKPSRLLFTAATWDTPQKVEVKAGQDADAETDPAVTLTHAASGGDYAGVTGGAVTVTITENDTKGVTVTPTNLGLREGAPPRTYTVVLRTQPTGTVRVAVGGLTSAIAQSLRVSPTVLTFNSGNWNIPKVVTVTALEDDDGTHIKGDDPANLIPHST